MNGGKFELLKPLEITGGEGGIFRARMFFKAYLSAGFFSSAAWFF